MRRNVMSYLTYMIAITALNFGCLLATSLDARTFHVEDISSA
jgi:hypothetical protein